jgi:hypothetical protein
MADDFVHEAWLIRGDLRRIYGAGTFVAVYDNAVIDWGDDRDLVRERAENAIGEPVRERLTRKAA